MPPGAAAGADHGVEVPYVFGRVAARAQKGVTDATDIALSRVMMHYWASFAATGDPNSPGAPTWDAYDPKTDKALWIGPVAVHGRRSRIPTPARWPSAPTATTDHTGRDHRDAGCATERPGRRRRLFHMDPRRYCCYGTSGANLPS